MSDSIDLGYATVDVDRRRRQGLPEVVYGPGKSAAQISGIVRALLAAADGAVLVTRVEAAVAVSVGRQVPGGTYHPAARVLVWRPAASLGVELAVVTAGTSDGAVADELAAVAGAVGLTVTPVRDVGVAGLHRLLARVGELERADIVAVVAGMEGALASVVAGLVAVPVVAVPTSTGYGASLEGVTALLAMISSCAAGITVVNIDSGFGAAMAAFRLAQAQRRPHR